MTEVLGMNIMDFNIPELKQMLFEEYEKYFESDGGELFEKSRHALTSAIEFSFKGLFDKSPSFIKNPIDYLKGKTDVYLNLLLIDELPIVVKYFHDMQEVRLDDNINIILVDPVLPSKENYDVIESKAGFLIKIKEEDIKDIKEYFFRIMNKIKEMKPNIICWPELTALDDEEIETYLIKFAYENNVIIIYGSSHDLNDKQNISKIYLPNKKIIFQNKIYPSKIGERTEGIEHKDIKIKFNVLNVSNVSFGILICIDAIKDVLIDELKIMARRGVGLDLLFNVARTSSAKFISKFQDLCTETCSIIVFNNGDTLKTSCIFLPFERYKDRNFRAFELTNDDFELFTIEKKDIALLQEHRKTHFKKIVAIT
ncbi:MAG: hypothetical protein NWE89_01260 [Candidatus Bathyarchaeota archaeon]|nr:hypothetical protein [Candidatus Bathyarchaeota archaeon]